MKRSYELSSARASWEHDWGESAVLDYAADRGLLVVSPFPEDHRVLGEALAGTGIPVSRALNLRQTREQLKRRRSSIAVVVTERELPDGTWKDVQSMVESLFLPPLLIVASRTPDAYLWAEVLNTCGFDVLAKPFARDETARVLGYALRHYQALRETTGRMQVVHRSGAAGG